MRGRWKQLVYNNKDRPDTFCLNGLCNKQDKLKPLVHHQNAYFINSSNVREM
jgi:hypothetical protein